MKTFCKRTPWRIKKPKLRGEISSKMGEVWIILAYNIIQAITERKVCAKIYEN